MCGEKKCGHDPADLCSCGPVQEGEPVKMLQHLIANMINETWELDYKALNCSENRRLCLVGVCAKCGGRLCINIGCANELIGNDFLVETYRQLRQLYHLGWRCMPNQEFWERFEQLFHEQDRPALSEWREWLEERYGEEKV